MTEIRYRLPDLPLNKEVLEIGELLTNEEVAHRFNKKSAMTIYITSVS